MKTQNINQETSKGQISKCTLGASAVLFGAVLTSLSVNAQDLWKEFSNSATYGKMALVMDGQLNETKNADAAFEAINAEVASLFISPIESEEALEVESWMTSEEYFNSNDVLESTEAPLEVETWMTEEEYFNSTVDFNAVEKEANKEIESWMTTNAYFNSNKVLASEPALEVEEWMLDGKNFSTRLFHEQYAVK
jgi:hypothetical protein